MNLIKLNLYLLFLFINSLGISFICVLEQINLCKFINSLGISVICVP